jgi:hypothetical protein
MLKSHQISKYHNSQVSMERAIHWNTWWRLAPKLPS